ncbi:MAG: hypothetical protein R2771_01040 [Saprospiraceae bacterium]
MLAKAVLRFAFSELRITGGSVHGEFGDIEDYIEKELSDIISKNIYNIIKNIFNALNKGIYTNGNLTLFDFEDFKQWILQLPQKIKAKVNEQK